MRQIREVFERAGVLQADTRRIHAIDDRTEPWIDDRA
jgi:hypothetical protein